MLLQKWSTLEATQLMTCLLTGKILVRMNHVWKSSLLVTSVEPQSVKLSLGVPSQLVHTCNCKESYNDTCYTCISTL